LDRTASKPDLTPNLYGELYEIAASLMRREPRNCSLQSTILVHDAYMALSRQRNLQDSERPALLAAAAQIMRRLLIDRARARQRQKRGGKKVRETLPDSLADDAKTTDVLELHQALEALSGKCATTARIVEMRFFGGMTHAEIAEVLGLSERTIGERWRFAKAWLCRAMQSDCQEDHNDSDRF
jgi:RNA polymerase sigma factor (TIGR02999 family)